MSVDLSKLTHHEVATLWLERDKIFAKPEVDLQSVSKIDSAGVAFLVQWAKAAPNQQLTVHHATDNFKALIKTFNLEPLFILS